MNKPRNSDHKPSAIICRLIPIAIAYLALCSIAQAVVPAPDGGYPNFTTAEGQNALLHLTTGVANTAVGWSSLESITSGGANTGVGAGTLALNTAGDNNTATGAGALLFNTIGIENTANGAFALFNNDGGGDNAAFGTQALFSNASGDLNNAVGAFALYANQDGADNNAFGAAALSSNISGSNNTAVGDSALANCTGNSNTALGFIAGDNATTGSGNVYVGAFVAGVAGESNHTYIKNIKDTSVNGGGTDTVTVDLTTGLLGHLSSSRRYKEDIQPMQSASEALYQLKPVKYRFKKEIDAAQSLDYGLLAEQVAAVDPNLAIRNGKGQIESVRYNAINAMLLNEFLKEHRKVQKQQHLITRLSSTVAQQQKQIEALAAGLEKVSAQVEFRKPAPQVVANSE